MMVLLDYPTIVITFHEPFKLNTYIYIYLITNFANYGAQIYTVFITLFPDENGPLGYFVPEFETDHHPAKG